MWILFLLISGASAEWNTVYTNPNQIPYDSNISPTDPQVHISHSEAIITGSLEDMKNVCGDICAPYSNTPINSITVFDGMFDEPGETQCQCLNTTVKDWNKDWSPKDADVGSLRDLGFTFQSYDLSLAGCPTNQYQTFTNMNQPGANIPSCTTCNAGKFAEVKTGGVVINTFVKSNSKLFDNQYIGASPTLVDIDGDGDLDMFVGSVNNGIFYYKNTGTSTNPVYTRQTGGANPFDNVYVGYAKPTPLDIDGDGDLDMFVGNNNGNIRYFENIGSEENPVYKENADNPLSSVNFISKHYTSPVFGDIDRDGYVDLLVGGPEFLNAASNNGKLYYYKNTGSVFELQTGNNDPFDGLTTDVGNNQSPTLGDTDGDGDLDLYVGNAQGEIWYFENTGSASSPLFSQNGVKQGEVVGWSAPMLADTDGDGDLDMYVGNSDGETWYFENTMDVEENCTPCPGGWISEAGQPCSQCGANEYSSTASCEKCEAGKFSTAGSSCTYCPFGQNSEEGQSCSPCPAGTSAYKIIDSGTCEVPLDQLACGKYEQLSDAGFQRVDQVAYHTADLSLWTPDCTTIQDYYDGESYVGFAPGGELNCGDTGNQDKVECVCGGFCSACSAGKFGEETGDDAFCTDCPSGWDSGVGQSSCTPCEAGKSSTAGSSCTPCDTGRWSVSGGPCTQIDCPTPEEPDITPQPNLVESYKQIKCSP